MVVRKPATVPTSAVITRNESNEEMITGGVFSNNIESLYNYRRLRINRKLRAKNRMSRSRET